MGTRQKKAVVIGAGMGGLAVSIRLAARGYQVDLFEKNAFPGGKVHNVAGSGYRFDAGPSLFTMPQYVDELISLAGPDFVHTFSYHRLPVICNYFWEDGTELKAHDGVDDFANEIEKTLETRAVAVKSYLRAAENKYTRYGKIFLEKSLHRLSTWANWTTAKAMLRTNVADISRSLDFVHRRFFKDDDKLIQLFNRYATYNGSDPYKTPGMMSIIPHFEYGFGAYIPDGGMISITNVLYDAARHLGVDFHFNSDVEHIITSGNHARGIRVNGRDVHADIVVSNADIFTTYDQLLPDFKVPRSIRNQERSTSALVYYWGIKKEFPKLDIHNILFSDNYRAEFKALSEGRIYEDPTVYINITSRHNESDAPSKSENWFVLINAPYDEGQNWEQISEIVRQSIIDKVQRMFGVDIRQYIEYESILDPGRIAQLTSSHLGSLYGTSSNTVWSAFLRHRNKNKMIRGLYHCGGSVHPGGGIPLCLLSAKITDEIIENDHR